MLKKNWIKILVGIFLMTLAPAVTSAQHMFQVILQGQPAPEGSEKIYIAGNFNQWNPSHTPLSYDTTYKIWFANLRGIPAGELAFKFTRGSWQSVETDSAFQDVQNRILHLQSDTLIVVSVAGWKDPRSFIQPTASANVRILDSAFKMKALDRTTAIRVYLPAGYNTSKKKYPVIYMQDGQNLFDEYTSRFGEWGVDEILDSLIQKGKRAAIVVGIDHGPDRINEYNPFDHEEFGKGLGDLYLDFLVKELKPFIDQRYRTLPDKKNTIIAGSSMGGLFAYYAMLKATQVFGKAGVFSPSFWIAPQMKHWTDSLSPKLSGKIFFAAGAKESESMVEDMEEIMDMLGKKSRVSIYSFIDQEGKHNESTWHQWFPHFYLWILADGNNYIMDIDD